MEATISDWRLLQPVDHDRATTRRCRNCQAVIDLSTPQPRIECSLA
jgi:hypothetical protein